MTSNEIRQCVEEYAEKERHTKMASFLKGAPDGVQLELMMVLDELPPPNAAENWALRWGGFLGETWVIMWNKNGVEYRSDSVPLSNGDVITDKQTFIRQVNEWHESEEESSDGE